MINLHVKDAILALDNTTDNLLEILVNALMVIPSALLRDVIN